MLSISLEITQNSQNTANNTSNVTVKVLAHWTYGSWSGYRQPGTLTIDGTQYSFSSTFNTSQSTTGSQTLYSKTLNIAHNSNGEKTLSCSASFVTGLDSSGTQTAQASKVLTTIKRLSTLSAKNGTLGTAQTLTVTRQSTSYTHTITYRCSNSAGTIATKSSSTSISWTPPLSLASNAPSATSVTIILYIATYNGSTNLGTVSTTITCSIPATVVPTVSLSVADANGYLSTYGAYVQGQSALKVTVSSAGAQGSTISSTTVTADGKSYTGSSVTTGVIQGSGTLTITAKVTDSRGRSATASTTITVLAYEAPKISSLSMQRCNTDGTANSSGAYIKVTFGAAISALNNKNTASYTLEYKSSASGTSTSVDLADYANVYSVSSGTYIFAADESGYTVAIVAEDAFRSAKKSTSGAMIAKVWSILSKGVGYAVGKVAELAGYFDIGWNAIFRKNVWMNNYDDTEKRLYFQNSASREGKTYDADGVYPHNCMLYGGSGTSLTGIGCYDNARNAVVWNYDDVEHILRFGQASAPIEIVLNAKSFGTGDSGWVTASMTSGFKAYSDNTAFAPVYRKFMQMVQVKGIVQPTSQIAAGGSATIFTLPEGYRPSTNEYFVCQGSVKNTWLLTITSAGAVQMSRYGGTEYAAATTGAWLPFSATFLAGS